MKPTYQELIDWEFTQYILDAPVLGAGTALREWPGVYPAYGLAYYSRDGEWRIAIDWV
ncbi:MAG: hypothetical protein JRJ84_25240 [Deltaproteobacteria bacterium]|nr:hypothetical protein [Deltaproteobacteria bacterium]